MAKPEVEIPPAAYGVAFPLASVGGYVDAVGLLTLAGLFVAHMSGNTIRLGVFIGAATGASPPNACCRSWYSRSGSRAGSP